MNTAIYSPSGASAGIGFAIRVDTLQRVVPDVLRHGQVIRPSLEAQFFPDSLSRRMGITGVIIARVNRDGAAAKAGLRPTRRTPGDDPIWGDLIVAVDDKSIETVEELLTALERHTVGDQVKLTVVRGLWARTEQRLEVPVMLAAERAE